MVHVEGSMAIARDPVLEELKRSISATASLASTVSTLSLEGVEQADIGKSLCREWNVRTRYLMRAMCTAIECRIFSDVIQC